MAKVAHLRDETGECVENCYGSDVCPGPSLSHGVDRSRMNVVLTSPAPLPSGTIAGCISHRFVSQFGPSVDLAFGKPSGLTVTAPFGHTISDVFHIRSLPQMGGIATRWIVAGVTHLLGGINRAVVDLVHEPMRMPELAWRDAKDAIASVGPRSLPLPAFVWAALVDIAEESGYPSERVHDYAVVGSHTCKSTRYRGGKQ